MILDPLDDELDASPLTEVLADPAVRLVVHAGRQDVALLRRRFSAEIANVFDTQIAAGFAGLGAQSSYDSLLTALLGLRLAKTASFTRWDTRPLSHGAGRLRTRGRGASARARRGARRTPAGAGQAPVGTRGVRGGGESQRRARSRHDPAAPAPRIGAERARPPRSPASSWPGGSRWPSARTGPSRGCSATRRWSSSPGAAPARERRSDGSVGLEAGSAAAAERSCWRSFAAVPNDRRTPFRRPLGHRRPSPTTLRWWHSPSRSCAHARAKPGWRTSCSATRAELQAIVTATRAGERGGRPHAHGLAARGRRSRSCSSCWAGAPR